MSIACGRLRSTWGCRGSSRLAIGTMGCVTSRSWILMDMNCASPRDCRLQYNRPYLRGVTMKAFTTLGDGIAALKLVDLPMPAPGPNDVLVKMTAAGLNYRDLLLTNG